MFKKCLKTLKEYETWENNSQRLNKGYKEKNTMNKLYRKFYR